MSLTETLALLKQKYFGEIETNAISTYNNEIKGKKIVPAYLFRGENRHNGSLTSKMERFRTNNKINESLRNEIHDIAIFLDKFLREHTVNEYKMPLEESATLLQHYGFPTEVIDVTSDLNVAASFAVFGNKDGFGRIYVYSTAKLAQTTHTIDMAIFDYARRPIRQKGYGIVHKDCKDLLIPRVRESVGFESYDFSMSVDDIKTFERNDYLCAVEGDQVLALFNILFEKTQLRNMSAEAKDWLKKEIPKTQVKNIKSITNESGETELEIKLNPEEYISYEEWKKNRENRKYS
jgi:hypothetical protein